MVKKPKGWVKEPVRHGLASKGVKTVKPKPKRATQRSGSTIGVPPMPALPRKKSPKKSPTVRMPGQWERHVLQQVVFAPLTRPVGALFSKKPPYPPYRVQSDDPRTSWKFVKGYRSAMLSAEKKGWIKVKETRKSEYNVYYDVTATPAGRQAYIKGALRQFKLGKKSMDDAIAQLEGGKLVEIPRSLEYK